jgi:hypothetical protein
MEAPKRIGTSWSPKEELQLLQNLNVGCTISTIAVQHKRSEGGIRSRINSIAQRMHDQGIDHETIINTVKITQKKLDSLIIQNKPPVIQISWVPEFGFLLAKDCDKMCDVYMNIGIQDKIGYIQGIKVQFWSGITSYNDFDLCEWIIPAITKHIPNIEALKQGRRGAKLCMDETQTYFSSTHKPSPDIPIQC